MELEKDLRKSKILNELSKIDIPLEEPETNEEEIPWEKDFENNSEEVKDLLAEREHCLICGRNYKDSHMKEKRFFRFSVCELCYSKLHAVHRDQSPKYRLENMLDLLEMLDTHIQSLIDGQSNSK